LYQDLEKLLIYTLTGHAEAKTAYRFFRDAKTQEISLVSLDPTQNLQAYFTDIYDFLGNHQSKVPFTTYRVQDKTGKTYDFNTNTILGVSELKLGLIGQIKISQFSLGLSTNFETIFEG